MGTLVIQEKERVRKIELKINHSKEVKSIEIRRSVNGSQYEKLQILGSAVFPLQFSVHTKPLGGVVESE